MHKSATAPLALLYAALILYASLYPFEGWRAVGLAPWSFLWAPLPRYWTGFDIFVNLAGYAPFGFLLSLGLLRTQPRWPAVSVATLVASLLSFAMEAMQTYLPERVASNVDLVLNAGGALLGAVLAWLLERAGAIARWSEFRARWFVPDSRDALVLLALWPVGLLFPTAVPLGLGQVMERAEAALAVWLVGTPMLEWLPMRETELQPLLPGGELLVVLLGLLTPCLLAYSVVPHSLRRLGLVLGLLASGVGVTALSTALSFGPGHAWAWLTLPVQLGLVVGSVLAVALLALSARTSAVLLLLTLALQLSVLNNASAGIYLGQTLQSWEQGRFIRFHGLAQWVGWLWPFAVLVWATVRLSRR
ncbi:MAG: VanZ family protein [Tibeticola sp.]